MARAGRVQHAGGNHHHGAVAGLPDDGPAGRPGRGRQVARRTVDRRVRPLAGCEIPLLQSAPQRGSLFPGIAADGSAGGPGLGRPHRFGGARWHNRVIGPGVEHRVGDVATVGQPVPQIGGHVVGAAVEHGSAGVAGDGDPGAVAHGGDPLARRRRRRAHIEITAAGVHRNGDRILRRFRRGEGRRRGQQQGRGSQQRHPSMNPSPVHSEPFGNRSKKIIEPARSICCQHTKYLPG